MSRESEEKAINVPNFGRLLFIERDKHNFLNRTTVLYGASDTGKTVVLKWIMKVLQDSIANIIVVSPTNDANKSFDGYVPKRCIHTNPTAEMIRDILERQKDALRIYNKANDIMILKKITKHIVDKRLTQTEQGIRYAYQSALAKLERQGLDYAEKQEQQAALDEKLKTSLIRIYKRAIDMNKSSLESESLDMDERYAIKYLYFNPSLLLILDDCAFAIEKWAKDAALAELFYNGRHFHITSIYTMQDDKKLLTDIRKNTFNNIFTDSNSAIGFFKNKANSFPTQIQKSADVIANYIFRPNPNGIPNYKKLVYNRVDKNNLRYIIADVYPPFKMGCEALWKLCESVPENEDKKILNEGSKFFQSFSI